MTGKFRSRKISFAQVSNSALRHEGLSLKAKGLYALIQSYITLDGFTLYKNFLIGQSTDGKKAFQSAWDELKQAGYLKQYRIRTADGYTYEYELLDEPSDQPALVNIGLNGEKIEPPQKGEGSVEPPQNGVGSKCSGFDSDGVRDIGNINNTIPNNINSNNIIISQSVISQDEYDELTDEQPPQFISIVDAVIEHAQKYGTKNVNPDTITSFYDHWQSIDKGSIKNIEKYLKTTIENFFKYRL